MSGHSKWSTIKRQKGAADKKRGQQFSKITRAITIAARQGGPSPDSNVKLRLIIEQARGLNMPKDNIERAIDRAAGGEEAHKALEEVVYEGYGPCGVAVIIETVTDNKQRTGQEVRSILERAGGSLGGPGSVAWMFKTLGLVSVDLKGKNLDEATLEVIDFGVEDVEESDGQLLLYTTAENMEKVKESLLSSGYEILSSELTMKPTTATPINDPSNAQKVLNMIEKLEESEDVQKVHANFDIPESLLETMYKAET